MSSCSTPNDVTIHPAHPTSVSTQRNDPTLTPFKNATLTATSGPSTTATIVPKLPSRTPSEVCKTKLEFPAVPHVAFNSENVREISEVGSVTLGTNVPILEVVFSPDRKYVVVQTTYDWCMYEYSTGNLYRSAQWGEPYFSGMEADWDGHKLVFSPDGKLLASTSNNVYDCRVRIWQTLDGSIFHELVVPTTECENTATGLSFSPDGKLFTAATFGSYFYVWDAFTGSVRLTLNGSYGDIQFASSGEYLASSAGIVHLWELPDGIEIGSLGDLSNFFVQPIQKSVPPVSSQIVKAIQLRLFELGYDVGLLDGIYGELTEEAVKSFQKDQSIEVDGVVGQMTWSKLFDNTYVSAMAISPRSDVIAVGRNTGSVHIWNVNSLSIVGVLGTHNDQITDIHFSPDGKLLFTASNNGVIKIWSLETTMQIFETSLPAEINNFFLLEDGTGFVVWDADGNIHFFGVVH